MTAIPAPSPLPAACGPLQVGDVIGHREVRLTRQDLVRYAGASGDLNPIHYCDPAAEAAGLPGVIAHGMLTMGIAVQLLVDWLGDPGAILDYEVRFTRPVPVRFPEGAQVEIAAHIAELHDEAGQAGIVLTVTHDGAKVLGKAKATVRLAHPAPGPGGGGAESP
jgi:acyl dehydratase